MRHKEHPSMGQEGLFPAQMRLSLYPISDLQEMPVEVLSCYSAMKYGDRKAVEWWAGRMAEMLCNDPSMVALYKAYGEIFLAPSAFGSVPTAATTLVSALAVVLGERGWKVSCIQIHREGGFERTNYGALGVQARQRAMRLRKIGIRPEVAAKLAGACLVVIDDLRCTGAHERAIISLIGQETQVGSIAFGYCVTFHGNADAKAEEVLNHASVQMPADLLPLFAAEPENPLINARMLKFILLQSTAELRDFCDQIGKRHCQRLYEAALSEDGYFDKPRFREGFIVLENWLVEVGGCAKRKSFEARNRAEGKVVAWNLTITHESRFVCAETGMSLQEQVLQYSRFKFGDVQAIQAIGRVVAQRLIDALQSGGSLRAVFDQAAKQGEFVSLTAPGVRNVVSASNFLMRDIGFRVNAWLTQQGLPTMAMRTLGRLSSGRDNYAELSAEQRATHEKTTQTIVPSSEYQDFPSHVIFLDDVEVSGQTAGRAKAASLRAGAISFHHVLAFRVDPATAKADASIEHRMNHFAVGFGLDATLAAILAHPDYQPVQRMLRLLLHPRNQMDLEAFLHDQVPDTTMLRLYLGAMGNDYLWIHSSDRGAMGDYAPSLSILKAVAQRRGLLDAAGLPY